jgi:hypothetical protein
VAGGRIGKIELGGGGFGLKWSIPRVGTQYCLAGEMSCRGGSRMVLGDVDTVVEVVEGQGKEIESVVGG